MTDIGLYTVQMDFEYVLNDRHWTLYSSNGLYIRQKRTYIGLYTVQMDFEYVLNDRHWTLYSSNGHYIRQQRTHIGLYTVQTDFTDAKIGHTLDSIQFKWYLRTS